jgi:hypothetical protein
MLLPAVQKTMPLSDKKVDHFIGRENPVISYYKPGNGYFLKQIALFSLY